MARGEAVPTSKTSELYVALYAVFVNAELTTLYRPPVASASSSALRTRWQPRIRSDQGDQETRGLSCLEGGGAAHCVIIVVSRPPPQSKGKCSFGVGSSGLLLHPPPISPSMVKSSQVKSSQVKSGQVRQIDFRASVSGFDLTAGEITVGLTVATKNIGFSVGDEIGVTIGGQGLSHPA